MSTADRWRAWRAENMRKAPLSDGMEARLRLSARAPLEPPCACCGTRARQQHDYRRDMLFLVSYPILAGGVITALLMLAA